MRLWERHCRGRSSLNWRVGPRVRRHDRSSAVSSSSSLVDSGRRTETRQLLEPSEWPLRVVVAVTEIGPKTVGSTDGMVRTERTSPYYPAWVASSPADLGEARTAVQRRDFEALAEISESSCLKMHGLMMAARPGLMYWNGVTVECVRAVRRLRAAGVPVFFTIDAGPQVKAICLPGQFGVGAVNSRRSPVSSGYWKAVSARAPGSSIHERWFSGLRTGQAGGSGRVLGALRGSGRCHGGQPESCRHGRFGSGESLGGDGPGIRQRDRGVCHRTLRSRRLGRRRNGRSIRALRTRDRRNGRPRHPRSRNSRAADSGSGHDDLL